MKIKLLLLIILVVPFLGASDAISAEQYIYKWKSSDGEINYTERPPEKGVPYEKVRRVVDKRDESYTKPAAPQSQKKDKVAEQDDKYNSWKKENCKIAMQNLDILENAKRIARDDGKEGILSDEEKAKRIEKMRAQKDKYCKGDEEL